MKTTKSEAQPPLQPKKTAPITFKGKLNKEANNLEKINKDQTLTSDEDFGNATRKSNKIAHTGLDLPVIPSSHLKNQTVHRIHRALSQFLPRSREPGLHALSQATKKLPPRPARPLKLTISQRTAQLLDQRHSSKQISERRSSR